MKIVAWNIKWGGDVRCADIAKALIDRNPDVVVISEYQPGPSAALVSALREAGWSHHVLSAPPLKFGGAAVVSKTPLQLQPIAAALRPFDFRYLSMGIPAYNLELRAVYAPLHKDPHVDFWMGMLADLKEAADRPVLMIGDLNAGESNVDSPSTDVFCSALFRQLPDCGYRDLWRGVNGAEAREHTWQGRVHPYRLDHAFGSTLVAQRVKACAYDHTVRMSGLSDHSLLWLEID